MTEVVGIAMHAKTTSKYKVEIMQTHKCHCFCCSTQVPMGCKYAVPPQPLTKNHTVNCQTIEENTRKPFYDNLCLFRALILPLHGNGGLEEETSKMFTLPRED